MKNSIAVLVFVLATSLSAQPNASYEKAVKEAIASYSEVEGIDGYQQTANRFQRIAQMNPGEWIPIYYQALTRVYMSFAKGQENDERDAQLEIADELAEKAEELSPENVEITVLKGYIKMAKLSVNPAVRGMYMTPQVTALFEKARKMDPENPRAIVMLARMKFGTAQFFKSGIEEPCALAKESLPYFEAENKDTIMPRWGKNTANSLINACSKNG